MRRALVAAALASSAAFAACSLFVSLDGQQCSVNSDCAGRGGEFAGSVCVDNVCVAPPREAGVDGTVAEAGVPEAGPDGSTTGGGDASDGGVDIWGCLSQPPEVLSANQQILVTLPAFDALMSITTEGPQGSDLVPISFTPVRGASIEGCLVNDPLCANPVASGITDDSGVAQFTLAGDFVGFFRLSANGYFPSATYPGQLLADASTESIPTAMLGVDELDELAIALGVNVETGVDSGVGHAFFEAYDCFDHHAPGVTFTILGDAGPGETQWYTRNGSGSVTATETDSLGAGGAVNVPAGGLTMVATLAGTQRTIGTVNAIIAPGETVFGFVRARTH